MDMYGKRKTAMVRAMETKVREMSNRARFIQEVVDNTIDLRKMADDEATDAMLQAKTYDKHDDKYDYLTRMPMHNMNKQRVQKILKEKEEVVKELEVLRGTSLTTMWMRELDHFVEVYGKYKEGREKIMSGSVAGGKSGGKVLKVARRVGCRVE